MKRPITPQILHHLGSQRNHPILAPLPAAHHQLALIANDVMHRERKTFREPQPGTIDQLDRDAVAAQADRAQQARDLPAGEHGGKFVVVACADLRKDLPLGPPQHPGEEEPGAGDGLADGLRPPGFPGFDVQDVVPELILAQRGRIGPEMLVQKPHGPVVAVPGARRIMAHSEQLGVSPHRVVGMVVVERIAVPLTGPRVDCGCCVLAVRWTFGVVHDRPMS